MACRQRKACGIIAQPWETPNEARSPAVRRESEFPMDAAPNESIRIRAPDIQRQSQGIMNFVAIDFETANYARDSACAVGLVKVVGGEIVDKAVHLIKPPTREFVFTYIHGLTWNDVATSADFGQLWPTSRAAPRRRGVSGGAQRLFRQGRSSRLLRQLRHSRSVIAVSMHCPDGAARLIRPTKLSDVCRKLGIALNHHEALSDAMACARIVLAANDRSDPR